MAARATIPVIDLAGFASSEAVRDEVARGIRRACREHGFFYVVGHGIDTELSRRLERVSREFFALDLEEKLEIGMERGGRAWRGYFPVGHELTGGRADRKEGLYLGDEVTEVLLVVVAQSGGCFD